MSAFLAVYAIFVLGMVSPGPDFAFITKQGLTRCRGAAVWSALGIGASNLVHIGYCMLGIGVVITRSILLFNVIKLLGAAYLVYIGARALFQRPSADAGPAMRSGAAAECADPLRDFTAGFFCNLLNPKCTLFFLALFTQVIDPNTPIAVQAGMGMMMAASAVLWFSSVGSLLSLEVIRRPFRKIQRGIERVMGALLIALGLKLAYASQE